MSVSLCVHCEKRKQATPYKRGLCRHCYNRPEIREQYSAGRCVAELPEPTEAELEAIIAEQRQCLPEWWYEDCERLRNAS